MTTQATVSSWLGLGNTRQSQHIDQPSWVWLRSLEVVSRTVFSIHGSVVNLIQPVMGCVGGKPGA